MMVRLGNFLFRYRNTLFPLVYLLLFLKSPPVFDGIYPPLLLGLGVAVGGQLIRAVAIGLDYIVRGGKNRRVYAEELVTGGLFSHCRNPLYLGNFLILVGVGIASNSRIFMAIGIPFFIVAYAAIIRAEENFLRNKFGRAFEEYCGRVNRIIPNLSGIRGTLSGMKFNWPQLVTAEYGSAFTWIAAMSLVTLKNLWVNDQGPSHPGLVYTAWSGLGVALLLYLLARFLKKSGILNPSQVRKPSAK